MSDPATDDPVRAQYEAYPYPKRDPEHERVRLLIRPPENLGQINHYVFGGRQAFGPGTRILVAGGGTGDETVYFAEQMRDRGGVVVYLDQSQASMAIARQRVQMRGLTNVDFRLGRIEDVSVETIGLVDYVHSIGVLHHLADPVVGLQRLAALLKPDGGMGLLLYAPHGRLGNYQLQSLAQLMFGADQSMTSKVEEMTTLIAGLAPQHPFFRGGQREATVANVRADPIELVDMVLHARDRPFSVGQVYDLLATAGLTVVEFVPFSTHGGSPTFTIYYNPLFYVQEPTLAARISAMPPRKRHEIAELMHGSMDLHCFYAANSGNREAMPDDLEMVPYFEVQRSCFTTADGKITMVDYSGRRFEFDLAPQAMLVFHLIDSVRTIGEILEEGARRLSQAGLPTIELRPMLIQLLMNFRNFGWVHLRHRSVAAFANYDHLYEPGAGWRPPEGFQL